MDLDLSGTIGLSDFGPFASCFGQCYEAGDSCLDVNWDASSDGCIGTGDLGGFAGCFSLGCTECSNCVPPEPGAASLLALCLAIGVANPSRKLIRPLAA